jgi:hypothetical protein
VLRCIGYWQHLAKEVAHSYGSGELDVEDPEEEARTRWKTLLDLDGISSLWVLRACESAHIHPLRFGFFTSQYADIERAYRKQNRHGDDVGGDDSAASSHSG